MPPTNTHTPYDSDEDQRHAPHDLDLAEKHPGAPKPPASNQSLGDSEAAASSLSLSGGSYGNGQTSNPTPAMAANDVVGSGYNDTGGGSTKGWRARITRRRAVAATGGVLTLLTGGGFLGFSAISGPLEIIHYAQILQKPFSVQTQASESRMNKLYRYMKSGGDVGETRVGYLGNKVYARTAADMERSGIKLNANKVTGRLESITIDKSLSRYNGIDGLHDYQAKEFIAEDNHIDPSRIRTFRSNGTTTFTFNVSDASITAQRGIIHTYVSDTNVGKITSFVRFRTLTQFYDTPSWLHPIKRLSSAADQKLYNSLSNSERYKAIRDQITEKINAKSPDVTAKLADLRDKVSGSSAIKGVALGVTLTGALCVAKDVADQIPAINRATVVVPAMKSAANILATGSQLQSGTDVNMQTVAAMVTGFQDSSGKSPFAAAALQATAGQPTTGSPDISPDVKQAFSPDASVTNVQNILNDMGANTICSTGGQIVQGVAGGLLLLTPGGWVAKAAGAAVGYAAIKAITTYIPKLLSDAPLTGTPHQGPQGGNIDAYGARALANASAYGSGGAALSNGQVAQLDQQQAASQNSQFQSKSFFARVLDPVDYRSLTGRIIDGTSASPTSSLASLIAAIPNFSSFGKLASLLMPRAQAAAPNYDFGFPLVGFSLSELNNGDYADPYANAQTVAQMLDTSPNAQATISRAKACFGVDIAKDGNGKWGVTRTADVNPTDASYTSANCDDTTDANWMRVRFFVLDTSVMEAYACFKGASAQACTNSGFGAPSSSTAASPGSTTLPTGDTITLAKQIEANPNISFQTPQDKAYFDRIVATGHAVECNAVAINPKLLGVILTLAQKYKLVIGVLTDGHGCDGGQHQYGNAVDLNGVNSLDGSVGTGRFIDYSQMQGPVKTFFTQFYDDAGALLSANKGGALGQSDCMQKYGMTPVKAPGVMYFTGDSCNHLHMDVRGIT